MIWQLANRKSSQQSEYEVKGRDKGTGDCAAIEIRRDCEFRDYPDPIWAYVLAKSRGQVSNFAAGEAVEEEVSRYDVIVTADRRKCASVRDVCLHSVGGRSGRELAEHDLAGVDGIGLDRDVCPHKPLGKSPISISQDERPTASGQASEKRAAATLKERAKSEPFHPAVNSRESVEIRRDGWR